MDDKAKIPIGEPGTPEAATSHSRKAITTKSVILEASDHNYHSVNVTPSVNLFCNVPESASDFFYDGQVYVGIKDSVFEGSDPMRHTIELLSILQSRPGVVPPYLVLFSDGGGDHNLTFLYVQCVLVALFKICDLDILNVGRCAPYQSFINPAERVMSILNIGLQGLALERDHGGVFEKTLTSCQSMKSIRNKADQHQGLKEAHLRSIEHPRRVLEECFSNLQLKGKPFQMFQPNRNDIEVVAALRKIEPTITSDALIPHRRAALKDYPGLESFLDRHLTDGLYLLQYRKCGDENCCKLRGGLMPPPIPAPVLSPDEQHYLPFDDLYGKVPTTEKDCPSLKGKKDGKVKKDQSKSFKFLGTRVVSTLECCLCGISRCVFNANNCRNLTSKAQRELEDVVYSCGMQLSVGSIYTSRYISCASPVENAFTNSIFGKQTKISFKENVSAAAAPSNSVPLVTLEPGNIINCSF